MTQVFMLQWFAVDTRSAADAKVKTRFGEPRGYVVPRSALDACHGSSIRSGF